MEQKRLIIILADISGYTRFMLENRTSAVHGQAVITWLIESLLKHVDIPLVLQEIEGDAVFLYAPDPGSEQGWAEVVQQVSKKLEQFFDTFLANLAGHSESNPCPCAICRNSHLLGLKIIVHVGDAIFHNIAGRPQISGADIILAHRMLKNTVPSHEYLLLSESAHEVMGEHLPGTFESHRQSYEGFGDVPMRVRILEDKGSAARSALYELGRDELEVALREPNGMAGDRLLWLRAALRQAFRPIRPFSIGDRLRMVYEAVLTPLVVARHYSRIVDAVYTRGAPRARESGGTDTVP